jgi:hypothetical protein
MRYPYSQWTRRDRREEARTRAAEYRRFTRMTDSELRAQARTLADMSETCYQDLARLRCALNLANRNGVTVWPRYAA